VRAGRKENLRISVLFGSSNCGCLVLALFFEIGLYQQLRDECVRTHPCIWRLMELLTTMRATRHLRHRNCRVLGRKRGLVFRFNQIPGRYLKLGVYVLLQNRAFPAVARTVRYHHGDRARRSEAWFPMAAACKRKAGQIPTKR